MRDCQRSDAAIVAFRTAGPNIGRCIGPGLQQAGVRILIGGRHVANWLVGQVRPKDPDEPRIREYARSIGVEEKRLCDLYRELPAMDAKRFEAIAGLLDSLGTQLSTMAYQNVQQARFISDRQRAEAALRSTESERARLHEELRARQQELERLSRVSALSGMASGLAHELSQPLAAARYTLIGCRALAESGQLTMADAAKAMGEALVATERASRIVEQMSQRSARRLGAQSTIDVAELLQSSIRLLSLDPELAGVTVSTRIAANLEQIVADPVQVEQVVINVLRNAIEATRKAGSRGEVQIEAASNASEVTLVFRDSGPGFTVESLQRAFEPFYSSKDDSMGLGLSISQDIIQRYGGRIHARNHPAGGAIVEFTLPLSAKR
jgi:C4-dicarboxylate-specific signal transduction histidine kinase